MPGRSYSTKSIAQWLAANSNYNTAYMQQEDFVRAQSAQAQADQGQQAQQQNPNVQTSHMQAPNSQHPYMQNPPAQNPTMQNANMQTPGPHTHDPNAQNPYIQDPDSQNQNQYAQNQPIQPLYVQYPQNSTSHMPNPRQQPSHSAGDFYHGGHRYNIHALHHLIDSPQGRNSNSPPPSNRGPNAFNLPSHGAYAPHNAPARPTPRLGPNGRPMIKLEHFGHSGEWVEMPDPQAYRREDEDGRAERERDMAAQVEFVERNPRSLGPTWKPSWRGRGGW